jgi:outer membrane protein, heavy metal efflux system
MKLRDRSGGMVLALAIGLAGARDARAQGPTLPDSTPARSPGGQSSSLGPIPGAGATLFQNVPGAGQPSLAQEGGAPPLGGRPGPSVSRAPASVTQPGGGFTQPIQGAANPIGVLQPAPLPIYGSLSLPTGPEDEGPPDGMTLDMAIERLVRENLELRAQFYEIPQARADVLTASLRANPVFYADSQLVPYGQYSRQRPGGPLQYDVNVTIPLDINNKRRARVEAAARAQRVIEAVYQDHVRLQIDNLYTAYVDVLAARETVRFQKASLEGLERLLESVQKKFEAGAIFEADRNRVRIQRDQAAIGLADAEQSLKNSTRTLASLLNIPPDQAESLQLRGTINDTASPPPPADELARVALMERPDVASYRLGLQSAMANVKLQRANRISDVYLLVQPYTFQNNTPFGTKSATSYAVGLTVPLPIVNRNQGQIERARLNVRQTQIEGADLERKVRTEVDKALAEYQISRQAVQRLQQVVLPDAQNVLATIKRQFDLGQIDVFVYLNALKDFNDIIRQYRDALVRHRRAMLDLNTALGRRILP